MTRAKSAVRYIVANPRGIPAAVNGDRIPVFRQMVQGEIREWYEGDDYTGPAPAEPLRRGFIVEVRDGEA